MRTSKRDRFAARYNAAAMQREATEFAGTRRFQVLRPIGEGGMGVVYEALDRERDVKVALKTLRAFSPEALLRFKQEFRSLQALDHPNLVTLGELIEESGQWFFTMELIYGRNFVRYVRGEDPQLRTSLDDSISASLPLATPLGPTPGSRTQPTRPMAPDLAPTAETDGLTMEELLDATHAAVEGELDELKLRVALAQLAEGLAALHRAGQVHRDVKPSNILVTQEGRVVILDFGLVAEVDSTERRVVGTVDYMAPEQALATSPGPAADWYSVGAVLYEALTGRPPFIGPSMQVLMDKQRRDPVAPRLVEPSVPKYLDELCVELLRRDPAQRPSEREILRRLGLGHTPAAGTPVAQDKRAGFIGRRAELAALRDAFEECGRGHAVTVFIRGESGVGKSALVKQFTDELAAASPSAVVLAGRCQERETVPFKAFDGVVDALSRFLARLSRAEAAALLPADTPSLAQVFQVLSRIEAVADIPPPPEAIEPLDPQALRTRAFAALRELFGRLVARQPVVVVIDDFQWADADSLALRREVLRSWDGPPLLFVATLRTAGDPDRGTDIGAPQLGDVRHLDLARLAPEEARALASSLLLGGGLRDEEVAAQIAGEAQGHPLFIDQLVRHTLESGERNAGRARLDEAIWGRIRRLDEPLRKLVELVAVAGAPITQEAAAAAASIEFSEFARLSSVLRAANIVRTSGSRRLDTVEPYHDQIRQAVLSHLSDEARAACHRRLALGLTGSPAEGPDALWMHWLGAGERERAAHYAALAADRAADALAFDRAARLYHQALELQPLERSDRRHVLQTRRGHALANAGRGADAAEAYLAAAEGASARTEALDLRRRAAEQLLISGHVDHGLSVLKSVLGAFELSLAKTPRRALASLLVRRGQLKLRGLRFEERDGATLPPEQLLRIDLCWATAMGLGIVDTIHAADFQARHLLYALEAGEPYRIARALAAQAGFEATGRDRRHARRLLATAESIARRIRHPHALGMCAMQAGIIAWLEGRWRDAVDHCQRAEIIFLERTTGVIWELDSTRIAHLSSLSYMGELADASARVAALIADARERGDLYAQAGLCTAVGALAHLASGQPDEAQTLVTSVMEGWSRARFTLQHHWELRALGTIDLYRGRGAEAYARVQRSWRWLEESLLTRIQGVRIEALDLRARAALSAAAAAAGRERASLIDAAERDARDLEREKVPWCVPLALLARAGAVALRGGDAGELLRRAVASAGRADMALHAAVAQRCLGLHDAHAYFARQKIADPAALSGLIAPGFPK